MMIFVSVYVFYMQADGFTDPFYNRLVSKKQTSLIIGTSRSAQGVDPQVLNAFLNRNDIYNYSFTLGHSPYGEVYFESIKKKINEDSDEGIFIVTVDPWSISVNINNNEYFQEEDRFLNKIHFVNQYPNLEYLLFYFNQKNIDILYNKKKSKTYLDNRGWLQVNLKWDSVSMNKRLNEKVFNYTELSSELKVSNIRLNWLFKTVEYLKSKGSVYIVRLPVHPMLFKVEEKYDSNFQSTIDNVIKLSDGYYDMSFMNEFYKYNDGNHLNKYYVPDVSAKIANWINSQKK
ncbi:hypothetical protein [Gaetbulibacter sp. NE]|uniref:hypothetical protein n=1 Tax=Gaetbulibacter sp. NE TaxID=2982307 RepID=UPI0021D1159E|nr:hypothetical protein [Gaetbulibacter sp. NE]